MQNSPPMADWENNEAVQEIFIFNSRGCGKLNFYCVGNLEFFNLFNFQSEKKAKIS